MGSFKNLRVWKASVELAKSIYKVTRRKPFCSDFGFCNQIQRSAVSIGSNIAEGNQRWSHKEAAQFYSYANGSVAELITQLHIAYGIDYLDKHTFAELERKAESINAMIKRLILAKKRQSHPSS